MPELFQYRLPFSTPLKTANGIYTERTGIVIRFSDGQNEVLSEASPLPGFSSETLDETASCLLAELPKLKLFFSEEFTLPQLRDFVDSLPPLPSVRYSLAWMGLILIAERKKKHLADLLSLNTMQTVMVNGLAGIGPLQGFKEQILKGASEGFTTFKIKAGSRSGAIAKKLASLSDTGITETIRFRLDANGSWPADQLAHVSSLFAGLPVSYIEEPTPIRTAEELDYVIEHCRIPIALDESLQNPAIFHHVLKKHPEIILVIKPKLFGNLFELIETISANRSSFRNVVVTTTLGSRIERSMAASIAAVIGDPLLAHGLHTGHLLEHDLIKDFDARNGCIRIPERGYWNHNLLQIDTKFLIKIG